MLPGNINLHVPGVPSASSGSSRSCPPVLLSRSCSAHTGSASSSATTKRSLSLGQGCTRCGTGLQGCSVAVSSALHQQVSPTRLGLAGGTEPCREALAGWAAAAAGDVRNSLRMRKTSFKSVLFWPQHPGCCKTSDPKLWESRSVQREVAVPTRGSAAMDCWPFLLGSLTDLMRSKAGLLQLLGSVCVCRSSLGQHLVSCIIAWESTQSVPAFHMQHARCLDNKDLHSQRCTRAQGKVGASK